MSPGTPDDPTEQLLEHAAARGEGVVIPDYPLARRTRGHIVHAPQDSDPLVTSSLIAALAYLADQGVHRVQVLDPQHLDAGRAAYILALETIPSP